MITVIDSLLKYTHTLQAKISAFENDYDQLTTDEDMTRSKEILDNLTGFFELQTGFFAVAQPTDPDSIRLLNEIIQTQEEIQAIIDKMIMLHADEPDHEFIVRMQKINTLMQRFNTPEYTQLVERVGTQLTEEQQSAFLAKMGANGVVPALTAS